MLYELFMITLMLSYPVEIEEPICNNQCIIFENTLPYHYQTYVNRNLNLSCDCAVIIGNKIINGSLIVRGYNNLIVNNTIYGVSYNGIDVKNSTFSGLNRMIPIK